MYIEGARMSKSRNIALTPAVEVFQCMVCKDTIVIAITFYLQVDSGEGRRQSKMAANSKSQG